MRLSSKVTVTCLVGGAQDLAVVANSTSLVGSMKDSLAISTYRMIFRPLVWPISTLSHLLRRSCLIYAKNSTAAKHFMEN